MQIVAEHPRTFAAIAAAALGVLACAEIRRRSAPFDAGLDEATETAVMLALARERDPAYLHRLAAALGAAGHPAAAGAVSARAADVKRGAP